MSAKRRELGAEVKIMRWVFGLPLVVWPLLAFGSIFIFDAPIKSERDEYERVAMVLCVWCYPLFYLIGWIATSIFRKHEMKRIYASMSSALPITPIVFFAIVAYLRTK